MQDNQTTIIDLELSAESQQKHKKSWRYILGSLFLLLLLIGLGATYWLSQQSQDIRQQAAEPTYLCRAEGNPWGACDCPGTTQTTSCQRGYTKWTCGNKRWIPVYGSENECGGCPWDKTDGQCCPTPPDNCSNLGAYKCIDDPYVSQCTQWDSSCPAGKQNYWKAIKWTEDLGEYEKWKEQYCGSSPPPPTTPPPTTPPPTTPSPSPSIPPGPQCLNIAMDNPKPKLGDQVSFICGAVSGADHYVFRIMYPNGMLKGLNSTGRVSEPVIIEQSGQYHAQCQICTGPNNNTCHPWEQLPQ
ncbi:hypothetical protein KJ654_01080 [Patescibacteria group bacterium]|nr:hypothetical protein [Patescibacteria group bacterium]